ncbi:AraC-like DNA-binding protein [Granulicella aggregans]|uniref:AraC-like DNA-binding protein n=1 Tax=Granulicella aggregans TaxID=474949 RepID=A0A7W7ZIL3_9BACT|nr:helix-turn-helix domain-containing protein [Granulicella aggregans]MBB5060492.1 AraC-like DNA-binding protein [Granulicella aggregans]
MASLESILSFNFRDLETLKYADGSSRTVAPFHILGTQTLPGVGCASFSGSILAFGIFLRPLALWQLFHIPSRVHANIDVAGEELVGKTTDHLWQKLAESKSFSQRIEIAERFLLPLAKAACVRTDIMRSANQLYRSKGATRIEELAHLSGLSIRQYQRRFTDDLGMTPKIFARITRFQRALDAKRLGSGRSWLSIAHELGYFDQMHMIRDFQSLAGSAPTTTIEQSGDLQPWSAIAPLGVER